MIHTTIQLEDITLVVVFDAHQNAYIGTLGDNVTGRVQNVAFTPDEYHALMCIVTHHDGTPDNVDWCYNTLEDAINRYDWNGDNKMLRPIP